MKKIAVLLSSVIIATTISACYGRSTNRGIGNSTPNTGMNRPSMGYNTEINQRTAQNYNTNQGTNVGYNTNLGTTYGNYRDGAYTGYGDMTPTGNQAATVYIKAGKITNVTLDFTDTRGHKIYTAGGANANTMISNGLITGTGNQSDNRSSAAGLTGVTADRVNLANAIIQNQTYNVNISGNNNALINNWKLAVRRALDQAKR